MCFRFLWLLSKIRISMVLRRRYSKACKYSQLRVVRVLLASQVSFIDSKHHLPCLDIHGSLLVTHVHVYGQVLFTHKLVILRPHVTTISWLVSLNLQGFDSACMAIYLATGRSFSVTLAVFSKWAACTGLFMFHTAEGERDAPCEKVR